MKPGDRVEVKLKPGLGGWRRATLVGFDEFRTNWPIVELDGKRDGGRYILPPGQVRDPDKNKPVSRPRRPPAALSRVPSYAPSDPSESRPKSPPARSAAYLAFVRGHPCALCGAPAPSDPHHFGPRGLGQKTDDFRAVPLCRPCHGRLHTRGSRRDRPVLLRAQVDLLVTWCAAEGGDHEKRS